MVAGFDPVNAFNLLLERLDKIALLLERIAVALEDGQRGREFTEARERLLGIIGEHCGFGSATYKRAESLAVLNSEEPE